MKMPQKIPKAVKKLRVLFRVMVMRISSHRSMSILNSLIIQNRKNYPLKASIGRIITALRAGKNPANVPAIINVKVAWMAM